MIADMINYKKLNPIVTEFFIQTKNIRLNSIHYFIVKIKKNFKKLHLINHEILTLKTL